MALVSGCISAVVAHLAEQIDGKSDSWAIAADNLDNVEIVHTGVLSNSPMGHVACTDQLH